MKIKYNFVTMIQSRNVLITGGAGYIGSHICYELSKTGYIPITFDNLSTGWEEAVKFGPLHLGSILDTDKLEYVFRHYNPVAVIHLAASSSVGEASVKPGEYWHNNTYGTLKLIETAIQFDCKNFIYSSSSSVYGNQNRALLNELTSPSPNNAYGASKLCSEYMIKNFADSHGLKSVIFRYFNVAGANTGANIGEFHRPATHIIPLIFDSISNPNIILQIYGADYDTMDGTCIRDYIHVVDLAQAHIRGLEWLADNTGYTICNLGTGIGHSVLQVIVTCQNVIGQKINYNISKQRDGDPAKSVSDNSNAISVLGINIPNSDLKTIICDAWWWHRNGGYRK